jgi:hypothetical protein
MEKQEVKITVEEGVKELVVRTGEAEKIHYLNKIDLQKLTISAAREFLEKPLVWNKDNKQIEDVSFIVFDYRNREILLNFDYRSSTNDRIHGYLELDPDLVDFGINDGKSYTALEMGQFIRFRRHFFENKDVALNLEKELRDFRANVDKKVQMADDKRGNLTASIAQTVISNLPLEFFVNLPVFIGQPKRMIKLEIDINPMDLTCVIVSPQLKEMIDIESKLIVDAEIGAIRKLHPNLRIFQR